MNDLYRFMKLNHAEKMREFNAVTDEVSRTCEKADDLYSIASLHEKISMIVDVLGSEKHMPLFEEKTGFSFIY